MATQRYFTVAEQAALFDALRRQSGDLIARRDAAWMRLLQHTGLRITEFSRLTVGDALAALKTGYLFIPREHRKGREGKKKDHTLLATAPVLDALRDLLAVREAQGYREDEWEPLVMSRKGQGMAVRSYQDRMSFWIEAAGLPGGSPHWWRHTRAMNIMRASTARDPRGVVQAALAHVSIASTGVYTGVTREEMEAALREVDEPEKPRKRQMRKRFEKRAAK